MKKSFPLVAVYDAYPEREQFANPALLVNAQVAAEALIKTKLSAIGRIGSPVISTLLTKIFESGLNTIGLSPASSEYEHSKAFRLANVSFPLLYTGRGALGADVMAFNSAHAVFILGADEESILGILGCINDREIPIAIFTDKNSNDVRELANTRYPKLMHHLFVSNDAAKLAHDLANVIRQKTFNTY